MNRRGGAGRGFIADGRAWLVRVDTNYRVAVLTETAQEWIGVSDG